MARPSLVSISSDSMFAMSTTMSSTAQNSYRTGRTLGGAISGFTRFGSPSAELEASSMTDPGPCEFRRLVGERGWGALSMGGCSARVGVETMAARAAALASRGPAWEEGCGDCGAALPCVDVMLSAAASVTADDLVRADRGAE